MYFSHAYTHFRSSCTHNGITFHHLLLPAVSCFVQELHSRGDEAHAKLQQLLRLPSVDILDESDELLKHKFQLVYAWGTQCRLPSVEQRILVIQHVLQVLSRNKGVKRVLLGNSGAQQLASGNIETEAMSLHPHPERYGSVPNLSLIHI